MPLEPERAIVLDEQFLADLRYWTQVDRRIAVRVLDLVEAVRRAPFTGIGKPEPLKGMTSNTWSRRITDEHRLVYVVGNDRITFTNARYHYRR
ncbi:MAG: Txe/YoeB family addiction module toxin [Chloroflexi bacterium]|nr:Txe/YoeB family addiction module toxin [Chloroflexota bacterium]